VGRCCRIEQNTQDWDRELSECPIAETALSGLRCWPACDGQIDLEVGGERCWPDRDGRFGSEVGMILAWLCNRPFAADAVGDDLVSGRTSAHPHVRTAVIWHRYLAGSGAVPGLVRRRRPGLVTGLVKSSAARLAPEP
jgi:hypothetical protein